jgi:SAM-dependent MidA family methyltransferase
MTQTEAYLVALIEQDGPISLGRYMETCLCYYYANREIFGRGGDFTTSPEISQVFGELIGLWAANVWQEMGAPSSIALAELGPGRGTMMADMLRAAHVLPAFASALRAHMVENSEQLRGKQFGALRDVEPSPLWYEGLDGLLRTHRGQPLIIIANEFLDALPISQFQRRDGGWHERMVGLDRQGALCFGLHPVPVAPPHAPADAPEGTIIEQADMAEDVIGKVARHIAEYGGAALFIDYGSATGGTGDTFQAVRNHRFVDVFAMPGLADLTVQVDFARMAAVAEAAGAAMQPLARQADFLHALGIERRVERLCANATPDQAARLRAGANRLVDVSSETAMGALFKVLCLRHKALPPLPGFAP